ncbi:putative membrane protein [Balneicella halophila]|uniref:Putative membrane protein n=1 Tax=Balneicella halophila TaxID=1537566 RepID=A0A7L4UNA2_BALHA|nr:DUF368 domain-containing protein [Balneicella halophila]PVX50036.1 putative membrane protein [Balneicella halophila]
MKRNFIDYLLVSLKGMGMGAADVVPGVSGGTIAFITGIYEELIFSIKSINLATLKLLFSGKFTAFSKAINLPFLLALFFGIGLSVLSLAKIMTFLLAQHPLLTWGFFFGLIIASAWLVGKKITQWNKATYIALILGVIVAYLITELSPASTPETVWFIFLSGMIAICAMILPGVSGAFILLMMGKYAYLMNAIDTFNLKVLAIFMGGAAIGIVTFSNILGYFLKKFHNATVAVLTGFMIGSLNKVWPWKEVVSTFADRHGEVKPLVERNISPYSYSELLQEDNYLLGTIVCAIAGFLLIVFIERVATISKKD